MRETTHLTDDVRDLKSMLQRARDNGVTTEDADYMRGLLEAILGKTKTVPDDPEW